MSRKYRYSEIDWQNTLPQMLSNKTRKPSVQYLNAAHAVLVEGKDVATCAEVIGVQRTSLAHVVRRYETMLDNNGARRLYPMQVWVPVQKLVEFTDQVDHAHGILKLQQVQGER